MAKAVSYAIEVNDDKRAVFDKFWEETTGQFVMPDPGRDGLVLTDENGDVLTDENDEPLQQTENWVCLFGESSPQHRDRGAGNWIISFSLVVLP